MTVPESDNETLQPPGQRRGAPTLVDVARAAGVSVSTAGRVMRDDGWPVDPEMRDRVRETAAQLGYVPNIAARTLRVGAPALVGLVAGNMLDPYYGEIAEAVTRHAEAAHPMMAMVCNMQRDPAARAEILPSVVGAPDRRPYSGRRRLRSGDAPRRTRDHPGADDQERRGRDPAQSARPRCTAVLRRQPAGWRNGRRGADPAWSSPGRHRDRTGPEPGPPAAAGSDDRGLRCRRRTLYGAGADAARRSRSRRVRLAGEEPRYHGAGRQHAHDLDGHHQRSAARGAFSSRRHFRGGDRKRQAAGMEHAAPHAYRFESGGVRARGARFYRCAGFRDSKRSPSLTDHPAKAGTGKFRHRRTTAHGRQGAGIQR